MRDADMKTLILLYTQDAADAKGIVGERLADIISAEPQQKKPRRSSRTWVRAAILVLALGAMLMTTSYGQALADYIYENVIQRLFPPIESEVTVEGEPDLETLYPFGSVVESDAAGHASYVIYVEDMYKVVQEDNLLRVFYELEGWTEALEAERREGMAGLNYTDEEIDRLIEEQKVHYETYIASQPPTSMEITQEAGVTVDDVVSRLKGEQEFIYTGEPSAEFPYVTLSYRTSTNECGSYYVRDNLCGGVFLIKTTHSIEAAEGHGARFEQAVGTLEVIEYDTGD